MTPTAKYTPDEAFTRHLDSGQGSASAGPWHLSMVDDDKGVAYVTDNVKWPSMTTIAVVKGRFIGEAKANARLIAAAPELLEALQSCISAIDGPIAGLLTGDSMNDLGVYDTLDIARAAITQATGLG